MNNGVPMDDAHSGLSPFEQEWRTCVTAITAAAEILRDYRGLHRAERDRFISAILDESDRLRRVFEQSDELQSLAMQHPSLAAIARLNA